jgi:hypothetical protein
MRSSSNVGHTAPPFSAIKDNKELRLAWFGPQFELQLKSATDLGAAPLKKPQHEDFSCYADWSSGAALDAKSSDDLLEAFNYYYTKANTRYLKGVFNCNAGCAGVSGAVLTAVPTAGISLLALPVGAYSFSKGARSIQQSNECKAQAAAIWQEMQLRGLQLEHSTGEQVCWWFKNVGSGLAQMAGGKVGGAVGSKVAGAAFHALK